VQITQAQLLARLAHREAVVAALAGNLDINGGDATTGETPIATLYGGNAASVPTSVIDCGGADSGVAPVVVGPGG